MAIKGKNRSRTKQRSAARPPRYEPVTRPTPLLKRWWVLLGGGFVLGAFAIVVLVWVTNNLRADDVSADAAPDASRRLTAATAYERAVNGAFGQIGVVEPGAIPTIFADMDAALDDLAQGKTPSGAATIFEQAADDAQKARKELAGFDVTGTVADQGFDEIEVVSFVDSARALLAVLDLYRQAARTAASAVEIEGTQRQRLADVAVDLRDSARSQLAQGWSEYLQALRAGGIPGGPAGAPVPAGPGLGGG